METTRECPDSDPRGRVIAVVGPTAAGKSELGESLALALGGQIVNADAFQFYRGMDIGTAKPTAEQQERIPHHCLDFLDINQPASVADFQARARADIDAIHAAGDVPIVVGGSALYLRAALDDLAIPPQDPAVRRRLTEQAESLGAAAMHDLLRQRDPQAADQIDPRNMRRVVRALEVVELTGSFTARLPEPSSWRPTLWLMPRRTRVEVDERIVTRTRAMWADGLLAEVAGLVARGLGEAPTAAKAVGYPQAMAALSGEMTPEQAMEATVTATRKLARRQDRIFRSDERITAVMSADEALQVLRRWLT